jgi:hypothetical protein
MNKNPVLSAFILIEYRFKLKKTMAQYTNKTRKANTCINESENKEAYLKLDKNSLTENR